MFPRINKATATANRSTRSDWTTDTHANQPVAPAELRTRVQVSNLRYQNCFSCVGRMPGVGAPGIASSRWVVVATGSCRTHAVNTSFSSRSTQLYAVLKNSLAREGVRLPGSYTFANLSNHSIII